MWAHYAEQYKGICVEYDLAAVDDVRAFLQPVYYSDKRPTVKSFDELNTYFNVFASLCKAPEWKYEQEWRLTFFTEGQLCGKNNRQSVPDPRAIYLGPRFEQNDQILKDQLAAYAAERKVPLVPTHIHKTDYRVVVEGI